MQILKATPQDIPAVRELWKYMFDDGTAGFCDFVFSQCKAEDIYIVKNNETLWDVAKQLGTSVDEIIAQNPELELPLKEGDRVYIYYQKVMEF